ncbi:hypothetical protein [Flavobacterium gyeonganense]|uniref:DUF4304 domain-containing protein n=1 Tax=Flavobacterium gyeonganense TaxID=1310418 RepID=A0ABV5HFI9_9FLAO|nr:hypothetical protein [Flavobacterium gyeonganense]
MKKEKLKFIIDNINIKGYKNFGFDDINGSCYLINTDNYNKWLQINLEINNLKNYTYLILRFKINFIIVTKILNKALEIEYRPEYPYWWDNADTLTMEQELFLEINAENIRPVLKNTMTSQDVNSFYKQIQFIYDQYLQPFIDKYPDLQTVNNEIIEKKSSDEWCNFIPGETIFKSLIVMKICRNKRYTEFLDEYKSNIVNAMSNGNSRYLTYYNQLLQLATYLESEDCKQFL